MKTAGNDAPSSVSGDSEAALTAVLRWAERRGHWLILLDQEEAVYATTSNLEAIASSHGELRGRPAAKILKLVQAKDRIERSDGLVDVQVNFKKPLTVSPRGGLLLQDERCTVLELDPNPIGEIGEGQLSEVVSASGELIAQIAHEIRNPLAGIATTIEIMIASLDDRTKEYCKLLKGEIERVVSMLKNLMDLAAPADASGRQCDFQEVLSRVLDVFKLIAKEKSISFQSTSRGPQVAIAMSESRLGSVLYNILANAVDAMADGGTMTLISDSMDHGMAVVRVIDSGKGIDRDIVDQIFKPFWSGRTSGTGLGLAVVKRFLDEAGGTIELDSVVGVGTMVTLSFPLVAQKESVGGR